MLCTAPQTAYNAIKGGMTFTRSEGYPETAKLVACNKCMSCRINTAQSWGIRGHHENQMHEQSCFVTLTYSDEHLPYSGPFEGGNLEKTHVQRFIQKLRDRGLKVRYFACGEYGDETDRAHYHILLFGFRPEDGEKHFYQNGHWTYTSEFLEEIWEKGNVTFGDVTYDSACYVGGYVRKKQGGKGAEKYTKVCPETGEIFVRQPEFGLQSLRPGIGQPWFEQYYPEIYGLGSVIVQGQKKPIPRYYDKLLEQIDPPMWQRVKNERAVANFKPLQKRIVSTDNFRNQIRIGTFEEEKMTRPQIHDRSDRRKLNKIRILEAQQNERKL